MKFCEDLPNAVVWIFLENCKFVALTTFRYANVIRARIHHSGFVVFRTFPQPFAFPYIYVVTLDFLNTVLQRLQLCNSLLNNRLHFF